MSLKLHCLYPKNTLKLNILLLCGLPDLYFALFETSRVCLQLQVIIGSSHCSFCHILCLN